MGRVFDGLRNGVFRALYGVLYGLRMAAWFMLSILRRPIQIVLGLLTFAGWIGGVIAWPLLLYYGEQPGSGPYEWQQYAMFIGVGLAMGILCPLMLVRYDSLLFRLQPQDRHIVYY